MPDRQHFPVLDEQIGEDPARFLDRDLLDSPGDRALVEARIRGIRLLEVIRAWMAVERRLGYGPDGGPRSKVIDWLDEREAEIEANEYGDVVIAELPESDHERPEKPDWVWHYEDPHTGEKITKTERKTGVATEPNVPWATGVASDGGE